MEEDTTDSVGPIASFLTNRAFNILSNQPDLVGFVNGQNTGGNLSANGNGQGLTLAFSTSRSKILAAQAQSRIDAVFDTNPSSSNPLKDDAETGSPQNAFAYASVKNTDIRRTDTKAYGFNPTAGMWDVWAEIYGSTSSAGNTDSSLWVGYLGAHYFTSENTLVGILGQLDWADETNSNQGSQADGFGWMVGPYIAGKFSDQNLFYEARVAYGQSDNDISPLGTFTDSFDTKRWLASGKLSGQYEVSDLTIRPEIRISWYEETQEAYTDSLSNLVPETNRITW